MEAFIMRIILNPFMMGFTPTLGSQLLSANLGFFPMKFIIFFTSASLGLILLIFIILPTYKFIIFFHNVCVMILFIQNIRSLVAMKLMFCTCQVSFVGLFKKKKIMPSVMTFLFFIFIFFMRIL